MGEQSHFEEGHQGSLEGLRLAVFVGLLQELHCLLPGQSELGGLALGHHAISVDQSLSHVRCRPFLEESLEFRQHIA